MRAICVNLQLRCRDSWMPFRIQRCSGGNSMRWCTIRRCNRRCWCRSRSSAVRCNQIKIVISLSDLPSWSLQVFTSIQQICLALCRRWIRAQRQWRRTSSCRSRPGFSRVEGRHRYGNPPIQLNYLVFHFQGPGLLSVIRKMEGVWFEQHRRVSTSGYAYLRALSNRKGFLFRDRAFSN